MRDEPVEHQSGDKCTKNALHSCYFHHSCTKEQQHHYKYILNDTVVVIAEEITCYAWEYNDYHRTYKQQLEKHKQNKPHVGLTRECSGNNGQHKKGKRIGDDCTADHEVYTAKTRQTVARNNGIGNERVRRIHTRQQHRCNNAVLEDEYIRHQT